MRLFLVAGGLSPPSPWAGAHPASSLHGKLEDRLKAGHGEKELGANLTALMRAGQRREEFCDLGRSAERCGQEAHERRRDEPRAQKNRASGVRGESAQQIQDQDYDQDGADDAGAAADAEAAIAETATGQQHDQKDDQKQGHELPRRNLSGR